MPHSGDFDDFYRRYYPRLVCFARKLYPGLDEEEIAQETLTRVCERFDTLDPGRDPWPYITQIARRVACDVYRGRSRVVAVDSAAITALADDVAPPADLAVTDSETRLELGRAMESLSGEHRRILRWRVIEGRTSDEIAEALGITPNAARQKVFRACRALSNAYFRTVPGATVVCALFAAIRRLLRKLRHSAGGAGVALTATAVTFVAATIGGSLFIDRKLEDRTKIPTTTISPRQEAFAVDDAGLSSRTSQLDGRAHMEFGEAGNVLVEADIKDPTGEGKILEIKALGWTIRSEVGSGHRPVCDGPASVPCGRMLQNQGTQANTVTRGPAAGLSTVEQLVTEE